MVKLLGTLWSNGWSTQSLIDRLGGCVVENRCFARAGIAVVSVVAIIVNVELP